MAKSKTKPVELWPAWESPNRLDYLPKYPRALYDQARALFTADNIEAASDALNPPDGFDLIGRLRRAVYHYFWCKAGSKGDTGFIDLMPKSEQTKELDDLIKKRMHCFQYAKNDRAILPHWSKNTRTATAWKRPWSSRKD